MHCDRIICLSMSKCRWLVAGAAIHFLVGCSSGITLTDISTADPPKGGYNLLFDQNNHIDRLLDKGKVDEASTVYNRERDFFLNPEHQNGPTAIRLAKAINDEFRPGQRTSGLVGKVIRHDVSRDLALIATTLDGQPVDLTPVGQISAGASLETIGHPRGLSFSITRGVLSAIRVMPSHRQTGQQVTYIQTDTPSNPGNSGGPLFLGNKVIGVVTWSEANSQNLNFAVDASEILAFLRGK